MHLTWSFMLGLLMAFLSFRSRLVGLCVFAAILPFDVVVAFPVPIMIALTSTESLFAGLVVGTLLATVIPRARIKPEARTIMILFALVLVTAGLSAGAAVDGRAVLRQTFRWAEFWLLLAAGAQIVGNRHDAKRVLGWYLAGAAMISVLCIMEVILGPDAWLNQTTHMDPRVLLSGSNRNVIRAHGGGFHPNSVAPYLGVGLLALLPLFPGAKGRRTLLLGATAGLLGIALLLTQTRTTWVAAAGGIVTCMIAIKYISAKRILVFLVPAVTVIAIGIFLFPTLRARVSSIATPWKVATFQWRTHLYKWGMQTWAAHPMVGIGAGNFRARLASGGKNVPAHHISAAHVHNFFIQVAMETGVLGLSVWLTLLGWLGWTFWKRRTGGLSYPEFGLGLLVLFIINNQLDVLHHRSWGMFYALGFGIALGGSRTPVAHRRTKISAARARP